MLPRTHSGEVDRRLNDICWQIGCGLLDLDGQCHCLKRSWWLDTFLVPGLPFSDAMGHSGHSLRLLFLWNMPTLFAEWYAAGYKGPF